MTNEQAQRLFPNIDIDGFLETSPINPLNNCFAWAGGDSENVWYPTKKYYIWFTRSKSESLENFIENYGFIGYKEVSHTSEYEQGFEKIAIYVYEDGTPSHAARQLDNGYWTSKLGILEDVQHRTLECVEGEDYGKVKVILKRPSKDKKQVEISNSKISEQEQFENFKNLAKNLINVPKKEIDEQLKLERENKQKNKKRK